MQVPALFGQDRNNSSRDYSKEERWGKNQFNSSFPASLVAWMSHKGIDPVYLVTDSNNELCHTYISGSELYRINPLSPHAYYNFEAGFSGFEKFYTGTREKIDLVMMDSRDGKNLAVIQMCCHQREDAKTINRFMRTIIWLYRMLFEYTISAQFDYRRIVRLHSYNLANDKAFALSGTLTYPMLKCDELSRPRIPKHDIKHIILGGGQNMLSPERRFDAVIVSNPDLFEL